MTDNKDINSAKEEDTNKIALRLAIKEDLNELSLLENLVFAEDQFSKRQLLYLITKAKGWCWVALYDNHIVGYLSLTYHAKRKNARIYSIAVSPSYQGLHIGSLLLKKAIETTKNEDSLSCITLEVKCTNKRAISFYLNYGFTIQHIIPEYYHDGSNAFYMKKELD